MNEADGFLYAVLMDLKDLRLKALRHEGKEGMERQRQLK